MNTYVKLPAQEFLSKYDQNGLKELNKVFYEITPDRDENIWIAGGFVRRICNNIPTKDADIDVFFGDSRALETFKNHMKIIGYKIESEYDHVINFKREGSYKVQAIKMNFYESADHLLDSFDYSICQFAYDGHIIYTTAEALYDSGRKRLTINKITYPVASLKRLIKYTNQGYYACDGCLKQLCEQIRELDSETYFKNLEIRYFD